MIFLYSCSKPCVPSSGQRYVVLSPQSGFGNRIQAVASAMAWALYTDRKFVLDWGREEKHMPAVWDELFKAPKLDTLKTNPDFAQKCTKDALLYRYYPNNGYNSYDHHGTLGVSQYKQLAPGNTYPPAIELKIDLNPIAYFLGVEARMPSDQFPEQKDLIKKFYKSLEPIDPLRKEINDVLKQHKCDTKLGFHFRSFATAGDKGFSITTTPVDDFLADIYEQIKKLDIKISNNSCIFAASDSPKYKKYIEDKIKNKYNVQVFTLDLKKVERDTVKGQQDALVEWFLLGSMDYLFGSNGSTFSDEAGRLTSYGKKITIGPPAFFYHVNNIDPL
jgi:hypothetical protein